MAATTQMINSDIKFLEFKLGEIKKSYAAVRESSKRRITIPAIFNRSGDENFISDYLAYILNPEINGIGIEPLQTLLSLAYDNVIDIELGEIYIIREYTFRNNSSYGRIDFVIELGEEGENGVIAIENKIYASEGYNQTTSYVKGLQSDYDGRDLYFIFLTPTGTPATAPEFKAVSYENLVRDLREIQYPVLVDIHKTILWEDFLYHLEEYIVMSNLNLKLSDKTRLYLDHHQMIDDLSEAYKRDSQTIFDYVTTLIKQYLGEDWSFNFQGRTYFQEVRRESWGFEKFYIFYQFFFSRNNLLTGDQYEYMLGVYPRNKESQMFFEWLRANKPKINEICMENKIEYFPISVKGTGSYVVAHKIYPKNIDIEDLSNLQEQFIHTLDEFKPFTIIIEDAVRIYKTMGG